MGAKSGTALKFLQWFIRGIQFACAALILAIYSYFLATLHNHDLSISNKIRAVEGISGIAVLYTAAALLLLCCLAGRTLSSLLAIILDIAFIGAFIYVAVANKGGASSCTGYLDTPFGRGKAAVSIVAIIFFILSILVEVALARHHRKEKRFGPGPTNDYTSGYGAKGGFFSRIFRRRKNTAAGNDDALPEHAHPDQLDTYRQSHATDRTAVNNFPDDNAYNKYENNPLATRSQTTDAKTAMARFTTPSPSMASLNHLFVRLRTQTTATMMVSTIAPRCKL
ncbi:hypothetical protein NXS19_012252 [Fusarium pseudograminearum]|nr:hypothetical protein NXS19_012252 [Fusarium pseudograminearum]